MPGEAAFLLKREGCEANPLFVLLERGVLRVGLEVEDQLADLRALMRRYRNRPMSLADHTGLLFEKLSRDFF